MSEQPKQLSHEKQNKKSSNTPLWIALFVLFSLIAGGYAAAWFIWQDSQQTQEKLDLISQNNMSKDLSLAETQKSLANRLVSVESSSKTIQESLTKLDKQALFNSKQLNSLHGSSRADWLMAEAEYLLRLANQRLNMEKDVTGAESILYAADRVLAEVDDPGLYPVRKQIAEEILELQKVGRTDTEGLYLQLEALISKVESLTQRVMLKPEIVEETPISEVETDDNINNVWQALLGELKKAVRHVNLDTPPPALMTADDTYYLKQNLRLMLEQAQLAMLKQEQALYDSSLTKAHNWIKSYFLLSSASTEQLIDQIEDLKTKNVDPEIPDVSASLRMLKKRIEALYRQHRMDELGTKQSSSDGDAK